MRLGALALGLVAACSQRAAPEPAGARPSILFVSIDSLRADHVSCYGYPHATTPTIDALAAEGVLFRTAVATTSWTLPSHAAMFTGLYDSAHGVVDDGLALAESHVTLAEALRAAGYRTAGFFGGPYLHPTYGLSQGFDVYESCMTAIPDDVDPAELRREDSEAVRRSHADVTSPRTLERVERWAEQPGEGPFFAFVHLWDVHYDYIPPPEHAARFDPDYAGSLDARDYMSNPAIGPDMDPRDLRHLLALYDGEILWTDEHLGRIVDVLRRRAGGAESLLVVVTSDHGEEFFEHSRRGHATTLFDESVRVPLVISWPGHVEPGRVVEEQVRTIDLFPTLAAAAGAAVPEYAQGRDLLALIERPGAIPTEPALLELWMGELDFRALRTETLKAHWSESQGDLGGFRLDKDPHELRPLKTEWPNIEKALAALRELSARCVELRARIGEPVETDVQPWLQHRLEQLGY